MSTKSRSTIPSSQALLERMRLKSLKSGELLPKSSKTLPIFPTPKAVLPLSGVKRNLSVDLPVDFCSKDLTLDSLLPHMEKLYFPATKDRHQTMTTAELSQEASILAFQSLQSSLGAQAKSVEASRAFLKVVTEHDDLSERVKATFEALKTKRRKYRDSQKELAKLKGVMKACSTDFFGCFWLLLDES